MKAMQSSKYFYLRMEFEFVLKQGTSKMKRVQNMFQTMAKCQTCKFELSITFPFADCYLE